RLPLGAAGPGPRAARLFRDRTSRSRARQRPSPARSQPTAGPCAPPSIAGGRKEIPREAASRAKWASGPSTTSAPPSCPPSASGAPRSYRRALYSYNPSRLYVNAVLDYARAIRRDPRTYYVLYSWQVFVRTTAGLRRLTGPRPR